MEYQSSHKEFYVSKSSKYITDWEKHVSGLYNAA
jgi:hypothetical protein